MTLTRSNSRMFPFKGPTSYYYHSPYVMSKTARVHMWCILHKYDDRDNFIERYELIYIDEDYTYYTDE